MNILIDEIPESVMIDGVEYEINTDFRISMMFELLMLNCELSQEEKAYVALDLFYPLIPHDPLEAIEAILWFYKCGKEDEDTRGHGAGRSERIYSFNYDDAYIYAAFLQQYGIDLQDVEHLHWWKFRALFMGLTDDCEFKKIMGYRAMDTSKLTGERKAEYEKLKRMYAIPLQKGEQEKISAIEEALQNGGDLTGLL